MAFGNVKSEFKSKIEVDPQSGKKCLVVLYDSLRDDFDRAINQAIAFHDIQPGQMNVIALPDRFNNWRDANRGNDSQF